MFVVLISAMLQAVRDGKFFMLFSQALHCDMLITDRLSLWSSVFHNISSSYLDKK
jgi:hypothetical protein